VRGKVVICGMSDARIPWPLCKVHRWLVPVVYKGLGRAVRRESEQAVAHWWGIGHWSVWQWRKALGVGATTEGTSRLRSDYCQEPWAKRARQKSYAKHRDPQRRAKIAAARRGKPRPRHVIEAMNDAWRGKSHTEEARRKMSEAQRRRGAWPPAAGRPWEPWEDELVRTLSRKDVARQTGRTVDAVTGRRGTLGLPDGRRRENKPADAARV
jgi:hypothetical protein